MLTKTVCKYYEPLINLSSRLLSLRLLFQMRPGNTGGATKGGTSQPLGRWGEVSWVFTNIIFFIGVGIIVFFINSTNLKFLF